MTEYAPRPAVKILIGNKDKTADFTPYMQSLVFEDHRAGESDRLTITLEDAPPTPGDTGPGLWLTPDWYPVKGAQVEAWMGYEGALLHCGLFEIDEISISDGAGGTTVSITALATPRSKPIRTANSAAYERKTLKEIAQGIAADHGLKLMGEPPEVSFNYVAQVDESDLAFLERLAEKSGAVFNVKGDKLVFHNVEEIAKQPPIWKIKRQDVSSASFSDKVTTAAVSYSYYDGDKQELVESEEAGEKGASADKTVVIVPVENKAQQQAFAKAKSRAAKSKERTAGLSMEGNTALVAGALVEIVGYGVLDGLWAIDTATHTVDVGGGYATALELKNALAWRGRQK